jgi:outer membrane protein assembly factor BamD (BamD/ComL family)
MNIPSNKTLRGVAALALFIIASSGFAVTEDDRELTKAAIPDTTPQEFYNTAISEAGGAYKEAQKDCKALPKAERSICLREAKTLYDHDMAEAREMRRNRIQQ